MNELLKRTNMMEEAKQQGKVRTPAVELLIFMAVYMISSYMQGIILIVVSLAFCCYKDPKLIELFFTRKIDQQEVSERIYPILSTMPEWFDIMGIFLFVIFAVGAVVYCMAIDKRSLCSMGLRKANVVIEYFAGLILGAVAISMVTGLGFLTKSFVYNGFNRISIPVFVSYLLAFAVQGFAGELLLRGYYLTAITKNATPVYALVSNGVLHVLLFTMNTVNVNFISIANVFLFAVLTSVYVIKRGNIWGVCGFHFAWKFLQIVVFGFNVDGTIATSSVLNISFVKGYEGLTGGNLGVVGGLLATFILFLLFGLFIKLKQNEREISPVQENTDIDEEENEKTE